jgi:Flp pilus assembly pilin Flp
MRELQMIAGWWRSLRERLAQSRAEAGAVSTEYVIIVATLAVAALAAAGIIAAKVIDKANSIGF